MVSRKTPLDGKLEVSAAAAARLEESAAVFKLVALGEEAVGRIESLECTCNKSGGQRHVHHFVVSPVLRGLTEGSEVRIELESPRGAVHIVPIT